MSNTPKAKPSMIGETFVNRYKIEAELDQAEDPKMSIEQVVELYIRAELEK